MVGLRSTVSTNMDFGGNQPDPVDAQVSLQSTLRREIVKSYYKRCDFEGAKQAVFHFGCMALSALLMWFFQYSLVLWTPCLLLHSFLLSFLFMGLHENVHGTAFKTQTLSDLFKNIYGFLSARPPIHYYYYHWAHHTHTGNPKKDPELLDSFIDLKIDNLASYLIYLTGVPFWIDRINTLTRHFFGIFFCKHEEIEYYFESEYSRRRCTKEARVYITLYCILTLIGYFHRPIGNVLFWYWFLPLIIGQSHLRFYLLAEHRGCLSESSDIFNNTRNTQTLKWYKKLAWYMPYHATHHAWPGVPFYLLHEVTGLYRDRVKTKCVPTGEEGYIALNYNFSHAFWRKDS